MQALFESLFQQFFQPLVAYAYRYLNDWQVAEDIVQDVFLALWTKKHTVDFNEPIKPYLYRATYNKVLNHLNSIHVQRRISPEETTDELLNQIIITSNQYDTLLLKEITHEIQFCVDTLPPQCKNIFNLSREAQMKNKEIAIMLDISEKSVEKHITKALCSIRAHLTKLDLMPATLLACLLQIINK